MSATEFDIQGASWAMSDVTVDGVWSGSVRRNGTTLVNIPSTESI